MINIGKEEIKKLLLLFVILGTTAIILVALAFASPYTYIGGVEPGTENDNPPPPQPVKAYVIDEEGNVTDITVEEAETYQVQEGETLFIEHDNGMTTESSLSDESTE